MTTGNNQILNVKFFWSCNHTSPPTGTYLCVWIVAAISATRTMLLAHWISADILLHSKSPSKYTSSALFCACGGRLSLALRIMDMRLVDIRTCFSRISDGQFVTCAIRSARKNLARLGVKRFNLFDVCDADSTLCKLLTPDVASTRTK